MPAAQARKLLTKFPSIGDPGADKILLFYGASPKLALESNGLLTLVRIGYGTEGSSYSTLYRSVIAALSDELPEDCAFLARAHQLLRGHGQRVCTRTAADCDARAVASVCALALRIG